MPYAPARPCPEPRCSALIRGTARRCALHQRAYEQQRGTAAQRGYDSAWQRLSKAFLREHPLCVMCGAPATEVDHIRPKRQGGPDEWANLQSLCGFHHKQKTAVQSSGWGGRGVENPAP